MNSANLVLEHPCIPKFETELTQKRFALLLEVNIKAETADYFPADCDCDQDLRRKGRSEAPHRTAWK